MILEMPSGSILKIEDTSFKDFINFVIFMLIHYYPWKCYVSKIMNIKYTVMQV